MSGPALSIERLVVRSGRVACDVVVAPGMPRTTTPALAARVRVDFPDLPRHACVNGEGDTFAAVMDRTSLPHLLEHLVVDLQTRDASTSADPRARDAVYVGTTEWTDKRAGRAHIEVSFTDDLVALRAFRDAVAYLDATVVP